MSILAIVALLVLVMLASGFYIGRSRAVRLAEGERVRLHSLPNYHGYHVAIWTGLPAFLVLLMHGVFSGQVVEHLTYAELRRAAAPLVEELDRTAGDDGLLARNIEQTQALRTRSSEIEAAVRELRAAEGEARDPERLSDLRAEQLDLINRIAASEETVRERRTELVTAIAETARAEGASVKAQAGFELMQAPREQRQLFLSDASQIASGETPSRTSAALRITAEVIAHHRVQLRWMAAGMALILALAGLTRTRGQIERDFRARNHVEGLVKILLLISSVIAILTTLGIVLSLLFESLRFFAEVPIFEFLFGLQWSPQIALRADQVGQSGAFGAVPLFAGTALITLIAMVVAVPIGLFAAIYLSEYAGPRFRATAKPLLEILAGIPTVVYGFFALLTVGPAIRGLFSALGYDDVVTQSALSAGLVMGIMIIPFISSLSDDVINAVPQTLRDGSYAMGATKSETITQVVMPAALPGVVGAILLGISRAVGETMIVVMAAGQGANLTANPLESVTTITVQIVMLLTGDQEFDSPKTLSAFALGLVLFCMTLIMNIIAQRVVQRYREKYD
ncbi:phosphate ABC transporter permease subunit PstC [Maricaulis sp. CAU 1757]